MSDDDVDVRAEKAHVRKLENRLRAIDEADASGETLESQFKVEVRTSSTTSLGTVARYTPVEDLWASQFVDVLYDDRDDLVTVWIGSVRKLSPIEELAREGD
jgi:hypothetical protein